MTNLVRIKQSVIVEDRRIYFTFEIYNYKLPQARVSTGVREEMSCHSTESAGKYGRLMVREEERGGSGL
jgi:hypothetical protein